MLASIATMAGLEIRDAAKRGIRFALLLLVASVFAFGGLFYALGAVRSELLLHMSAGAADLAIGGALFLCAALITALAFYLRARKPSNARLKTAATLVAVPVAAQVARIALPGLVKAVPAVVIAGFLIGRFMSVPRD